MGLDYFQAVRREGKDAIPLLEGLVDVNLSREDGQSLLHAAVTYNNVAAALALIRLGINVNSQDARGQSPLHYAAAQQNREFAEILLGNGADLTVRDEHGNTALWAAVFNARGRYEVVDVFVRHGGAKVAGTKNRHGRSPLDFATQIGDKYLMRVLCPGA